MVAIRELFDKAKPIDRRIEKVITYETTNEDLLKQEIQEYVATESIEANFERLLDRLEEGLSGGEPLEVGVWVSGFYGSGKSSFTKYLGFALDKTRALDDKPFLEWLQNQFESKTLRARLAAVAKKYPSTVIMLDLASEMLAGATMAEISTVLYSKVMQWAGYSRDEKVAYLELLLEKDGKLDEFKERISELSKGKSWDEIKNQPLVVKTLASRVAPEFYSELWPDSKSFNEIKLEEKIPEDTRVMEMLELIRRKTGNENIVFILDEVGQYVVARDDLILNLDGFAKNVKNLGRGRCWVIATAQQTLTEDDPRAATNTAKLFKLKDRFPVSIDLEASDIREICYRRLLGKSAQGEKILRDLFGRYGSQLKQATDLTDTNYYKSDLDQDSFCMFYPFLPQHFDILLQLLSRLARTRGGIGLRSAIKVLQDVLVDPTGVRKGKALLANEEEGVLADTVVFYDTLKSDIENSFPHIVSGVEKAEKVYEEDSLQVKVAKSIAILQILEDFPVSRANVAALLHPSVSSASLSTEVSEAVDKMLNEESIPVTEVDDRLRFMSEAVLDVEKERSDIKFRQADLRSIQNAVLREIFDPAPSARLLGTRTVSTGFKVVTEAMTTSLSGEKEAIQTITEFIPEFEYETKKNALLTESSQERSHVNAIFLLGREDSEAESLSQEVYRSREIVRQQRNRTPDKEVEEYSRAQEQFAQKNLDILRTKLKKALAAGSFIFRGKPRAVSEFDADVVEAAKKHLEDVAGEVYHKYGEAPVQADSAVAERFLKTEKLDKVASRDDPLSLVKKSGSTSSIDAKKKALVSIKDYLEERSQVDGRRLLDDLFAPPYGWSKDTTRYIVAAMLVAGIVKLRVGGADITVCGDIAIESLKNANNFNKIEVWLRDNPIDADMLNRARERLLVLTGEEVLPLEPEISKCVMNYFSEFQKEYAPLAALLENLHLAGEERTRGLQASLADALKGDASDAPVRFGAEDCPLYDDLCWAREVKKAFDNGIDEVIRKSNTALSKILSLPDIGIPGRLIAETRTDREQLSEYIGREDFYKYMPEIQNSLQGINTKVEAAVSDLIQEQGKWLETEKARIQNLPEWSFLGTDDKSRLGAELDALKVLSVTDLVGLQELVNSRYVLQDRLGYIESEIQELAYPKLIDEVEVSLNAPRFVTSWEEIEALISRLEELKTQLAEGITLRITW